MKHVVFFLGFLLTLALFAQRTECFTAGIGNVGVNGKRQVKVSRKNLFALYMKQNSNLILPCHGGSVIGAYY